MNLRCKKDGSVNGLVNGGIEITSATSSVIKKGVKVKGDNDVCMYDVHSQEWSASISSLEDASPPLDGVN